MRRLSGVAAQIAEIAAQTNLRRAGSTCGVQTRVAQTAICCAEGAQCAAGDGQHLVDVIPQFDGFAEAQGHQGAAAGFEQGGGQLQGCCGCDGFQLGGVGVVGFEVFNSSTFRDDFDTGVEQSGQVGVGADDLFSLGRNFAHIHGNAVARVAIGVQGLQKLGDFDHLGIGQIAALNACQILHVHLAIAVGAELPQGDVGHFEGHNITSRVRKRTVRRRFAFEHPVDVIVHTANGAVDQVTRGSRGRRRAAFRSATRSGAQNRGETQQPAHVGARCDGFAAGHRSGAAGCCFRGWEGTSARAGGTHRPGPKAWALDSAMRAQDPHLRPRPALVWPRRSAPGLRWLFHRAHWRVPP